MDLTIIREALDLTWTDLLWVVPVALLVGMAVGMVR